MRWRSAYVLGQQRDVPSVDRLISLLRDPEVMVQHNAADALAQIDIRQSLEALAGALGSSQPSVRDAAMSALETVGEPAIPALEMATNANNALARRNAATVLGYIGSPLAMPALQLAIVDPDATVRYEAEWARSQISRR